MQITDSEYYDRCSYIAYYLQDHATVFNAPQQNILEYSKNDLFFESPKKIGYVESFEYSVDVDDVEIVYIESNKFIHGMSEDGMRVIKMKWKKGGEVSFNVFKREDRPGLADYFQKAYDHIKTLEIAESLFEF